MQSVLIPDRELAITRFSDAALNYDSFAAHQKLVASELLNIVKTLKPERLLELGCGTGILSTGLNELFPKAFKVFSDGAPAMVDVCRNKIPATDLVSHKVLDFEEIPHQDKFDLIVSSCALQWLSNPLSFMKRHSSLLEPHGMVVHAIPVEGMLGELEQSVRETGGNWNSLSYISGDSWDNMFNESGFSVNSSFSKDFTVIYPSPVEALKAVRGIGASLSGHSGATPISVGSLRKTLNYYGSRFGFDSGAVPATYKVHFLMASGDNS